MPTRGFWLYLRMNQIREHYEEVFRRFRGLFLGAGGIAAGDDTA